MRRPLITQPEQRSTVWGKPVRVWIEEVTNPAGSVDVDIAPATIRMGAKWLALVTADCEAIAGSRPEGEVPKSVLIRFADNSAVQAFVSPPLTALTGRRVVMAHGSLPVAFGRDASPVDF